MDCRLDIKVRIISIVMFPVQKEGRIVQRILINLIDEAGEILRAFAWGSFADHFFKVLKVYYILKYITYILSINKSFHFGQVDNIYTLIKGSVTDVKSLINSPRTYCLSWMTWIQNNKEMQVKMIVSNLLLFLF